MKKFKTEEILQRHACDARCEHYASIYYQIDPESRLYLPDFGEGDCERFARIFKETWDALPFIHKPIVSHWVKCSGLGMVWGPKIVLHGQWSDEMAPPTVLGRCMLMGNVLYFNPLLIDAIPESCVATTVAHELCHVLQWAEGRTADFFESGVAEEDVRWLLCEWGFDDCELDDWFDENVKTPEFDEEWEFDKSSKTGAKLREDC